MVLPIGFKGDEQMKVRFELRGTSAEALADIASETGRTPLQTISDALETFSWILSEQRKGHQIVSEDPATGERLTLTTFRGAA